MRFSPTRGLQSNDVAHRFAAPAPQLQNLAMRQLTLADRFLAHVDEALRTVAAPAPSPSRPSPAKGMDALELTAAERAHAAALMRVNHTGEICAQALYQGQALTAKSDAVRAQLLEAAKEEGDHLAWSAERVRDLGGRASVLNPLWYVGSFAFGALAGGFGDKANLGFVAETEKQVEKHLADHLEKLPPADTQSRAVLMQMQADEVRHGRAAREAGGAELPLPVKLAMQAVSKVMTRGAYYV
jgi:3-demethoxyubiquinol 3-hydroxylase